MPFKYIKKIDTPYTARSNSSRDEDYVYIPCDGALVAFDIDNLVIAGTKILTNVFVGSVYCYNGYIFVITRPHSSLNSTLRSYTFNGSTFTEVASLLLGSSGDSLCAYSTYVFVGVDLNIQAYNFNGSSFSLITSIAIVPQSAPYAPYASEMACDPATSRIFVACSYNGVELYTFNGSIFSLIDRFTLAASSSYRLYSTIDYICFDGTYVYASETTSLIVLQPSPTSLSPVGFYNSQGPDELGAVVSENGIVYLTGSYTLYLKAFVFNGSNLTEIACSNGDGGEIPLSVKGNRVIISPWDFNYIEAYDLEEPYFPISTQYGNWVIDKYNFSSGYTYEMSAQNVGNYLFVRRDDYNLWCFDISSTSLPYVSLIYQYNSSESPDSGMKQVTVIDDGGDCIDVKKLGDYVHTIWGVGVLYGNLRAYDYFNYKSLNFVASQAGSFTKISVSSDRIFAMDSAAKTVSAFSFNGSSYTAKGSLSVLYTPIDSIYINGYVFVVGTVSSSQLGVYSYSYDGTTFGALVSSYTWSVSSGQALCIDGTSTEIHAGYRSTPTSGFRALSHSSGVLTNVADVASADYVNDICNDGTYIYTAEDYTRVGVYQISTHTFKVANTDVNRALGIAINSFGIIAVASGPHSVSNGGIRTYYYNPVSNYLNFIYSKKLGYTTSIATDIDDEFHVFDSLLTDGLRACIRHDGIYVLWFSGNYLLTPGYNGLTVYDTTILSSAPIPILYKEMFNSTADTFVRSGNYIYVVTYVLYSYTLYIVDITNPIAPTLISSTDLGGSVISIDRIMIVGDYLYIIDSRFTTHVVTLIIYDISNKTSPLYIKEIADSNLVYWCFPNKDLDNYVVDGDVLYGIYTSSVVSYDMSDPLNPVKLDKAPALFTSSVNKQGNILYIGSVSDQYVEVDVSDPANMNIVGRLGSYQGSTSCPFAIGSLLYSPIFSGLDVYDPSKKVYQPYKSVRLVSLNDYSYTDLYTTDVKITGNYAFVCRDEIIDIVDISNTRDPSRIAFILTYSVNKIWITGNTLLIADWSSFLVYDITVKNLPVLLATISDSSNYWEVAAKDNYAYVIALGVVEVYDISNPAAPTHVSSFTDIDAYFMCVIGDRLAISDYDFTYAIYDISNAGTPALILSHVHPEYITQVASDGTYVYVCYSQRLQIFTESDLVTPLSDIPVGFWDTIYTIAKIGNYILLGLEYYGFSVVDVSDPLHPFVEYATGTIYQDAYGFAVSATSGVLAVAESYDGMALYENDLFHFMTPDFTSDVVSGSAPLTVQFTDLSTGSPTTWLWDFGDGDTSIDQNPEHTYVDADVYTVSLTINGTATETKPNYITVNLVADFSGSLLLGKIPLSVFFTDKSKGHPSLWTWNFGDGVVLSGTQNPMHIYALPGTYTVSLIVSNGLSTDEIIKEDYITVLYPLYTEDLAIPEDRQDLRRMPIRGTGNYLFSKNGIRVIILRSNTSPTGSGFSRSSGPSLIFD